MRVHAMRAMKSGQPPVPPRARGRTTGRVVGRLLHAAAAMLALAVLVLPLAPAAHAQSGAAAGHVRLVAVGDIMMGSNFPDPGGLHPAITRGVDATRVLEPGLVALFRGADLAFGNLEGTLFDGDGPHKQCGNPAACYVFRSPEFYADFLRNAGFRMVSVANNHSGDFLVAGRAATRAALARAGIAAAGHDEAGGRTATITLPSGIRVGLIAFAPNPGTLPLNEPERAAAMVAQLARNHDIVVVSVHAGAEGPGATRVTRASEIFLGENRGNVYAFAHRMIDAGADLVLGSGPHVPRAVELYHNRMIAYSLGNFWTYGRFNNSGLAGVGPVLDVTMARDGRALSARIHGTRQAGGAPRLDPTNQAAVAIAGLTQQDFPESALRIRADGTIVGPGLSAASP